ncbi:hypothetical protein GA0070564_11235 [Micromonospora mirobrigensis]|uniref:Uncharacterized protein n=1 Tax=Micromonospora mirobrigensis TaxID=262898 RepID=A0A1C5AKV8_9ACTN|nr:hypothetical protein GA0070564_11235 [Micromonospora mirobrigensis]
MTDRARAASASRVARDVILVALLGEHVIGTKSDAGHDRVPSSLISQNRAVAAGPVIEGCAAPGGTAVDQDAEPRPEISPCSPDPPRSRCCPPGTTSPNASAAAVGSADTGGGASARPVGAARSLPLRNGDTCAGLAAGFEIGVATDWRHLRDAIALHATAADDLATAVARIRGCRTRSWTAPWSRSAGSPASGRTTRFAPGCEPDWEQHRAELHAGSGARHRHDDPSPGRAVGLANRPVRSPTARPPAEPHLPGRCTKLSLTLVTSQCNMGSNL